MIIRTSSEDDRLSRALLNYQVIIELEKDYDLADGGPSILSLEFDTRNANDGRKIMDVDIEKHPTSSVGYELHVKRVKERLHKKLLVKTESEEDDEYRYATLLEQTTYMHSTLIDKQGDKVELIFIRPNGGEYSEILDEEFDFETIEEYFEKCTLEHIEDGLWLQHTYYIEELLGVSDGGAITAIIPIERTTI